MMTTTCYRIVTLILGLLVVAGCSAAQPMPPSESDTPTTAPAPPKAPTGQHGNDADGGSDGDDRENGGTDEADTDDEQAGALVARATGDLPVYDAWGAADPVETLPATTPFGSPTTLLVLHLDAAEGWVEVLVPVRPNGTSRWLRLEDVEVAGVSLAVTVDLDARALTVLDAGAPVLTTDVAIGDPDHPTPSGRFFVTDKLDTGEPDGPDGPFALGLSAFSDVLTEFAGGECQVGIHGTNDPSSIGRDVSKGCVRVPNDVATWLAEHLPLGTPVTIA